MRKMQRFLHTTTKKFIRLCGRFFNGGGQRFKNLGEYRGREVMLVLKRDFLSF